MDFSCKVDRFSKIGKQSQLIQSIIQKSTTGEQLEARGAGIYRSHIGSRCQIKHSNCYSVDFENEVQVGRNCLVSETKIGKRTYLASNVSVFHGSIGSYCSIGQGVVIGHAEHPMHLLSTSPLFYNTKNSFNEKKFILETVDEFRQTMIGHDVWIGANAYIKSGINIGNGAVIGAHSVVTKDVIPYSVVAGVPAKIIKMRFAEETLKKLMRDEWWQMDDQSIIDYQKTYFQKGNK
jgi:acetyltransferase-like isoleucine patch superfamily enzyme